MTIATAVTLLLTLAALFASTFALFAARRSLALSRSRLPSELLTRLAEAEANLETLSSQLRNVRSRLNMQAYRARKAEEPEPEADNGAEWRRRMNAELAAGRISAIPTLRK